MKYKIKYQPFNVPGVETPYWAVFLEYDPALKGWNTPLHCAPTLAEAMDWVYND